MAAARKTRRLLVLGVLVGVGAVAAAVWPRGSRLEWYTSPPIPTDVQQGNPVRLRLLVPVGWTAQSSPFGPDALFVISPRFTTEREDGYYTLRPPTERTWLATLISRLVARDPENASIDLRVQASVSAEPGVRLEKLREGEQTGPGWLIARRAVPLGEGCCSVEYSRTNRAEFESTYRAICESFRVVR